MLFKDIKILNKNFEISEHQYVFTDGAFIKYVGPEPQKAAGKYVINGKTVEDDVEVIDGCNKFLMPAFYNTHCHVPMTLLRGYGEGLPLQEWLNTRIFPFEAKFKAGEKYWGAALGACELIKSGCISISDMYYDMAAYSRALYDAGMKGNICNGVISFDDNSSYVGSKEYMDTMELLDFIKDHDDGRIKADIGIHAEYTTRAKVDREAGEYAKENGMIIQIHISETRKEVEECFKRHGFSPVQYFNSIGVLDNPVVAAHCVWLDDEDISIFREKGTYVAHNPSSNLKLGSGIADIGNYRKNDVRVTLGTDGASSNNNLNMMEEMHLAALLCRGISMDANCIEASEILRMCTRTGALAQGRTDCGIIDEGMRADLIMFDLDKPHLVPDYDTAANIVFAAQESDIAMTVCDGRIVYKDGELTLIDEEEVKAKAIESFHAVCSRSE